MARYVHTLAFAKPQEEVFDYMADFSNAAEWDPATPEGERLDDGPLKVGSSFRILTEFAGRELTLTYRIVRYDPPEQVVLQAINDGTTIEDSITVKPIEGGCELTYDARIHLTGIAKLADPIANLIFRRLGGNAVRSLRETIGPPPG